MFSVIGSISVACVLTLIFFFFSFNVPHCQDDEDFHIFLNCYFHVVEKQQSVMSVTRVKTVA